ncbi:ATP-binding protein [Bacteroidales bacterium OttesenSCG-928-K03]|nr:ATP-binding protein [Bacteroidales bacterium OttesenSCG-928-K03]
MEQQQEFIMSVSIINDIKFIEPVLSAITSVAQHYGISQKDIAQLALATEEAIVNVINFAYNPNEKAFIDVMIEIDDLDFTVIVRDKGKPFDFTSLDLDDDSMSGLGVKMMQNLTDKVEFRNLGNAGREQRLIKHLAELPEYSKRDEEERVELPEDIKFDFHDLREHEAIEVARCVYDEFGYTYPSELVYYPQRFYEACQRGDIYSIVATTPDGEVAGHLALVPWKGFNGVAEMAIGVIKRKYRKYSLITILTDMIIDAARDKYKLNGMFAQPVAYHTITQKMCNRNKLEACSFALNYDHPQFTPTFEKAGERCTIACAMLPFTYSSLDIYLPNEVNEMVMEIYNRMNLNRNIREGKATNPEIKSEITLSVDHITQVGKVHIKTIGDDIQEELKKMMLTIKKEKSAIVEAYINLTDPSAPLCYEELKKHKFFCTGIFPLTTNGDYLTMECLLNEIVDYDGLKTIEPFTSLLNNIRKFDYNEM